MCPVHRDALWGDINLDEPVLAELVESAPVRRLRGIHQAGASQYLLPYKPHITRFEHSVGVVYVLRVLGAGLEEQVAGLLHDVPHTAFSHTADIVFPNDEHNFHERFQHEIISRSSIPSSLERHGINLAAALEPDAYPLLEHPLPGLCADRVDYALRDMSPAVSRQEAEGFLGHLIPTGDGILVDSIEPALWFARLFRQANDTHWTEVQEAGAYWALAGAIRRAYEIGAFADDDLFSTDEAAMSRLRACQDDTVQAYLSLLAPGNRFYRVEGDGPHFTTRMKNRVVDPPVLKPGWAEPRRLSAILEEYATEIAPVVNVRNLIYRLWSDSMPPLFSE
jgi:hypothetical protein